MGTLTVTEIRQLAELRHRDPEHIHRLASDLVPTLPPSSPERAAALGLLGLAAHELGRPADAITLFRRSLRMLGPAGDARERATVRSSLAMSLLATGDTAAAHRELARARAEAPDPVAVVDPLWAVLLQRTGRHDEALATFDRTLPALRREHDVAGTARLLLNRGTLLAYRSQFTRAEADLVEAERLAVGRELWLLAAMAAHNLGFTAGRRGDVGTGLAGFDRARAAYRAVGDPPRQVAVLAADHCELLLRAGLAHDARIGAERALAVLDAGSTVDATHHAELRLLLAQAFLADGDADEAAEAASVAAAAFRASRRSVWAALADYVSVQAAVVAVEDQVQAPYALVSRARRIARTLDRNGWPTEALHVRTLLGRVAISLDLKAVAARELSGAGAAVRGGTVDTRTTAWQAVALRRLATDDRSGAKRALRQGLRLVEHYRTGMATTELRAGVGARATELARLGLRLALADGRPAEVLRWAERWRAGALRLPPVTPPVDDELADLMSRLHESRSELRDATLSGADPRALQRRVGEAEQAIRDRSLRTTAAAGRAAAGLDLAALRRRLGEAVLVEYIAVENRLVAVTVTADGQRLHDLGRMDPIRSEVRYLVSEQRRRMLTPVRGAGPRAQADVPAAPRTTAERLEQLLFAPLGLDARAPLVVVPTGALHGLPWAALPRLFGHPLVVAPSADLWHQRGRAHHPADGSAVALIAGPDLPGALDEVTELARGYSAATVLVGPDATVAATLGALQRAELVHIAAHGQFRADSPLFSSILLADGSLTVAEMERLTSAPATVVLPVCDAARNDVRIGDELIGTTTALLSRGVRSVIAPVLPVPDDLTAALMTAVHRNLRAGMSPSESLAAAAPAAAGPVHAVAASFVCMGAGES